MLEILGLRGEQGCLTTILDIVLLVYAIVAIATGEATPFAWSILIGAVMDVLLKLIYRWRTRRNYNRADSYWSKKEESDDSIKDE